MVKTAWSSLVKKSMNVTEDLEAQKNIVASFLTSSSALLTVIIIAWGAVLAVDGEISVADIAIIEKDFLKNIHGNINHNEDKFGNYLNWDSLDWDVPAIEDEEISHLNVGTISELDTFIEFNNSSFIKQQVIENAGFLDSMPITGFQNE